MTGQQTHTADLSKLASSSASFEHALYKGDEGLWIKTINNLPGMLGNAVAEIEQLLDEKQNDDNAADETVARVKMALAVLKS